MFFIYGCILEFILFYGNPIKAFNNSYYTHKTFIALRFIFVGFSLIPLFYLLGFILKRFSDPHTVIGLIQYILTSFLVLLIIDQYNPPTEPDFKMLMIDAFPFNYFKFGFSYSHPFEYYMYRTSWIQFIYCLIIFPIVWLLHRGYHQRHKTK
jgi:hypothetical protein